jgi:phosphoribosylanthranilate isomerase
MSTGAHGTRRERAALWIKVCGLRFSADVDAAVAAGVDAVGFVFHAPSPRNVDPPAARALGRQVPAGVAKVAVFLHPTQEQVDAALDALAPDYVQTDVADLATLRLPQGTRALPVLRSTEPAERLAAAAGRYGRYLLESGRSGAGERADWSVAAQLADQGVELVLAGGLTPANVAAAVRTVQPYGVDVSSGVERSRSVKDAQLIREFVQAARSALSGPATAIGE